MSYEGLLPIIQDPQWVMAIATVALTLATFLLALVAAFQDRIRRAINPPKLHVAFRQSPPLCRLSYWRGPGPKRHREAYVFHFEVANEGRAKLRSLEAVVEEIWVLDDPQNPEKVEDFYSTNLRYGGEGTQFIDLNPGRRIAWNFGHISVKAYQAHHEMSIFQDVLVAQSGDLRFLLDFVEYPNAQVNSFPPGTYALKIVFYSENANSIEKWLKVEWSGDWKPNLTDMFNEIVIAPVPPVHE